MAEGAELGRIGARMAGVAPHAALLLGVVLALGLAVARLPGPVVGRTIEGDFRAQPQGWQVRILQHVRAGARAFATGALAEEDRAFPAVIADASDFHRLSLLDGDGRIFWSSRDASVGSLHAGPGGGGSRRRRLTRCVRRRSRPSTTPTSGPGPAASTARARCALRELNEWLQSCRSLPEILTMIARFMAHLPPGASRSLDVYSNSRDVLGEAASWNGARHDAQIRPEDCWGRRHGRTYAHGHSEVDFPCGHAHHESPRPYLCMPILAHGDAVGLMTLTRKAATSQADFEAQRRIAQTCAEQVSLAIANVRMRDESPPRWARPTIPALAPRRGR